MELKELQEQMKKTQKDFEGYVDLRLKEIAAKGRPSPETEEILGKINTRLDTLQAQITNYPSENEKLAKGLERMNERLDALQAKAARPRDARADALENGGDAKEQEAYFRKGWGAMSEAGRQKAMSVGSDPDGGFFILPDTSGRIVGKIFETTPMRQVCDVVTITTDKLIGPIDNDEVSSGWTAETGSRAETDSPEIGQWEIPVHEQYALPKQTQQLLDDAGFDVGTWLENKIAQYFARQENAAFITGTGVAKPKGITIYTAVSTDDSSRAWGQTQYVATGSAGDWTSADKIFDLENALKSGYRQNAVFIGPKSVLLKARKFKTGDGQYLWQPGLEAGRPARLIGYPYLEGEDMPAIASNSLSLAFGDFRAGYTIVDRQGIRVLRDPFTGKPYVLFYTTKRVGGGIVNFEAIKFLKFSAS